MFGSRLDLRLSFRMLVRYPVLTLVGGLSLASGVALGASVFAFISLMLWPSLPLPDGDRIVGVRLHDHAGNFFDERVTADFLRWRHDAVSITDLGAGRGVRRNLTTADGIVQQVLLAEVTASTFDMVRVAPIMGRVLTDADADPIAPSVIVIGHGLWRARFAGDRDVVGRMVIIGDTPTTVVGVMPEGFAFPRAHDGWVPLQIDQTAAPRSGGALQLWGRLKSGVDLRQAGAEMATLGRQASAEWPATHAHLRPVIEPFADSTRLTSPEQRLFLGSVNVAIGLLIGIRVALGSSRARVVLVTLRRPLIQIAAGIVVGAMLILALSGGGLLLPGYLPVFAGYILVMFGACLAASLEPARRALRVDPIAALRIE